MTGRYRKKPIVIEATQFDPINGVWPEGVRPYTNGPNKGVWGYIETLEGRMDVSEMDWIITGVKGEKYPCKPDIFASTYDPIP